MGGIFSKFFTLFSPKEEFKIIVLGLDNAGKTTILYQLLLGQVLVTTPTIGSNVEEIRYKNFNFVLWDISGQESFRGSWNAYCSNAKCVILVVDSEDEDRLSIVKEELYKLLENADLSSAIILIFANKQDKSNALDAVKLTNYLNLTAIKDHSWHIQPCSAINGTGLNEGLNFIVERLRHK